MHAEIVDLTLRLDKAPPNVRADDSEVMHAHFVSSVPAIYVYTCVCDTHARTNAHTHTHTHSLTHSLTHSHTQVAWGHEKTDTTHCFRTSLQEQLAAHKKVMPVGRAYVCDTYAILKRQMCCMIAASVARVIRAHAVLARSSSSARRMMYRCVRVRRCARARGRGGREAGSERTSERMCARALSHSLSLSRSQSFSCALSVRC